LEATRLRAVITEIKLETWPDGWEAGQACTSLFRISRVIYVSATKDDMFAVLIIL
jgi:hypothetical protein